MTPYRNVSCSAYDRLEAFATRRVPVEATWRGADGAEHHATAPIDDLFSDEHGEWLRFGDGRTVRLDQIVRLDEAV